MWNSMEYDDATQNTENCSDWTVSSTDGDQRVDHAIQVVEEAEQVEGQLDPSLSLAFVECVSIHDGGGVIQSWT